MRAVTFGNTRLNEVKSFDIVTLIEVMVGYCATEFIMPVGREICYIANFEKKSKQNLTLINTEEVLTVVLLVLSK